MPCDQPPQGLYMQAGKASFTVTAVAHLLVRLVLEHIQTGSEGSTA